MFYPSPAVLLSGKMDCALCKKPIKDYHPEYNHMEIEGTSGADICSGCVERFGKWQQRMFASLFPTKAAKRRYGRD